MVNREIPDLGSRFKIVYRSLGFSGKSARVNFFQWLTEQVHEEAGRSRVLQEDDPDEAILNRLKDKSYFSNRLTRVKWFEQGDIDFICKRLDISVLEFLAPDLVTLATALFRAGHSELNWQALEEIILETSGVGTVPTLFSRDELPIWAPTNHSNSKPEYLPPTNDGLGSFMQTYLKRKYGVEIGVTRRGVPNVSALNVRAATLNFRSVDTEGNALLVRIYRRLSYDEIKELHRREELIFHLTGDNGKPLFKGRDFARPLRMKDDENTFERLSIEEAEDFGLSGDGYHIALYPFAENVRHFAFNPYAPVPPNETDAIVSLKSLAQKLAQLHVHLRDFKMDGAVALRAGGYMPDGSMSSFHAFSYLFSDRAHEFSEVWKRHSDRIRQACLEHDLWLERRRSRDDATVLFDLHTQNSFFDSETNECVLIFDFEGLSTEWGEDAAFSFTVHRYLREFARSKGLAGKQHDAVFLRQMVFEMANSYREAGGRIAADFEYRLGSLIRITNIGKLFNSLYFLLRGVDPGKRRTITHDLEARKFLLHLLESEFFDFVQ